jgi:hypothetical protein
MVNPRVLLLTFINIVVLVGLFKWIYPEGEVTDIPLIIAILALTVALVVNKLLQKYLSKGGNNVGHK